MAASPKLKVFDAEGAYQAACHEVEAAAVVVSFYGDGATIRYGHAKRGIVWTEGEGRDGCATDNYDHTGEVVYNRIAEMTNTPRERFRWE